METIHALSHRLFTISAVRSSKTFRFSQLPPAVSLKNPFEFPARSLAPKLRHRFSNGVVDFRAPVRVSAGWFSGLGAKKRAVLPEIVKAGDPVLHEPASEVPVEEIGSERIQKIIDDMIGVMRKAPGVGLAAPQIGIPLKIIVLEDTKDYIAYAPKNEIEAQDRCPFDLLVILNPKMKKKSNKTALFFEGCLRLTWVLQNNANNRALWQASWSCHQRVLMDLEQWLSATLRLKYQVLAVMGIPSE